MAESWKIKVLRWRFNWYPAYRRTGARVVHISEDLLQVTVRLPLNRATRNVHGTIFGGAMYAAVDPLHAVMLAANLGPGYHVWMKAATIAFQRPGRGALLARAQIGRDEVYEIREALQRQARLDRDFSVALTDEQGTVAANFVLTLHIKRRGATEPPMHESIFP